MRALYILKPCLGFRQAFYFKKALETSKKVSATLYGPPTLRESLIIWMTRINGNTTCKALFSNMFIYRCIHAEGSTLLNEKLGLIY
jgi:hypothetical protein